MKKTKVNKDILFFLTAIGITAVFYMIPPIDGLTLSAVHLLGIFAASVFLWMTVGITWPSLFCIFALTFLPELTVSQIVGASAGNPAISFLIFTFFCSGALNKTQFTRRCAIWFITRKFASRSPWMFLFIYFMSILLLGSCMSTTVIVLIYLNINEEIFKILNLEKGDKLPALMTMGLVITASISGAMTPIAHVFPLVAMNLYSTLTGSSIGYAAYMAAGIPAALLSTIAMMLIFKLILKPDVSGLQNIDAKELGASLKPADTQERIVAGIFGMVIVLWVMPDLIKGVLPEIAAWISSFGTVTPPLLGALLLCVICIDGKPLLTVEDGAKSVPWPSMFMAASALALGSAMTNADIGLSEFIKAQIQPITESINGITFVFMIVVITALMTNIGSNMVSVTIISTVVLPITLALNGNVGPAAMAVVIGMTASYAFATPTAMTTVVLGTGSGWTTNAQMAKYGFVTLVPCILAIAFVAYPIAQNLL